MTALLPKTVGVVPSITKVTFLRGGIVYYIDGERDDDIYDDSHLLRKLLGSQYVEKWIVDSDDVDEDDLEAHIQVQAAQTTEELESLLQDYPDFDATE